MFNIGATRWPGISKLIEECGELGQVCGKLIALAGEIHHWDGSNLKERLEEELADVLAACDFVAKHCDLDLARITARYQVKLRLFEEWQVTNVAAEVG